MSNQLVPIDASLLPALVKASGKRAGIRFLEFFAAQIRNPHTRRAYGRAVGESLAWCESVGVTSLPDVQPLHVASWIELEGRQVSAPSVKQRLAALRHLFDWLVTGQVVPVNPAASVRGPRHQGNRSLSGSTPARDRSASAGATDAFTRRMKSGPMKA